MVLDTPELVNVQPAGQWSALFQAAEVGDIKTMTFLLERGANVFALSLIHI